MGETISYTYTVTNPGDFDLSNPTLTETGFTGAGTAPLPVLDPAGDTNSDGILQTTETWVYTATYALVAADLVTGDVENQATATGDTPGGTTVTDLSDSSNPGDGDGVGTPQSGPGNDDPTVTPFTNATIAANDDILPDPVDASVALPAVLNVLEANGTGAPDTLNGAAADTGGATPVVISPDPTNPVPAGFTLNASGDVDVAAGTPPDIYTFGYEICEQLSPSNCDTAIVEITIGGPAIGILKQSTFNDENFDGFAQVGETITYTYTISNQGDLPLSTVTVTETPGGFTGAGILPAPAFVGGDTNGDSVLDLSETWFYEADYALVADDLTVGDVANLASAEAESPSGAPVSDLSDSQNPGDGDGTATPGEGPGNDDPIETPLALAPIVATDDSVTGVNGLNGQLAALNVLLDNGGGPDTLGGTATNAGQVTISEITPATPIDGGPVPVLNPATGDVDVPPGTPAGLYEITYEICETLNPDNCDTATASVTVGTILAAPETFPATPAGGTTTVTVLDYDLLNGAPATVDSVDITLVRADPGLTLNPGGTVNIAPGTPAGPLQLTYEICDTLNPTICATVTETIQVLAEPSIMALKTQVLVDDGDGVNGAGDRLDYTITLTNGDGTVLTLDSGPTFDSSTAGSPAGSLAVGESATYTASYTLQNADVSTGLVSNTVLAEATPVPPVGFVGPPLADVQDSSDEGNPSNGENDPTVFSFLPMQFVEGLSVRKIAAVSMVQRGGVVPYVIEVTNDNTAFAVAAITVDTLPQGFVLVDDTATIDGVPTTAMDVVGRVVSFPTQIVPAGGSVTIELTARVLTGAPAGDAVNTVIVLDALTGAPIAPPDTAVVRIEPEAVFDCGDVIGKVYDDQNGNGYQDQGEPGLPSVRIATVDGTIITTDEHGRYHVPCALLPETRGTNFILKVDERSLPTGYRVTTENPRVIRLTRGKVKEMNFGASISQVVRVDINFRVYGLDDDGKMQLVPAFTKGIEQLLTRIKDTPSTLRVAFHVADNATEAQLKTGRKMAGDVKSYIRKRWRRIGDYKLNIETTIVRRK